MPGDLQTPTGGYAYARHLIGELPACGWDVAPVRLPDSYPFPGANAIAETERLLLDVPRAAPLLIDGLALGAMPPELVAALPQPVAALVHHPLGLESGLSNRDRAHLLDNERRVLAHADTVIATSQTTADTLTTQFAVAAARVHVAEPGVAAAERARGSDGTGVALLAVGAVSERKGYDVLIEALARLPRDVSNAPGWTLTLVGDSSRAPETAERLRALIAEHDLTDRITMTGAISAQAVDAAYASADAFVLSSRYEGYGMVLTEALARGLPIVSTTGGAAAQTLPDAAGIKIPPDDALALSDALARMIGDADLRARYANAAWAAAADLPRWSDTAASVAAALNEVVDV
ncbi:MAG: glycosyltransferase family 4 protein [Pseudomonadota bacterium]